MKVKATQNGFFDKYRRPNDRFTINHRSDEFIIKQRKDKSDKKVSDSERKADIEQQFSHVWMVKVS